jgi:hypothetical protein
MLRVAPAVVSQIGEVEDCRVKSCAVGEASSRSAGYGLPAETANRRPASPFPDRCPDHAPALSAQAKGQVHRDALSACTPGASRQDTASRNRVESLFNIAHLRFRFARQVSESKCDPLSPVADPHGYSRRESYVLRHRSSGRMHWSSIAVASTAHGSFVLLIAVRKEIFRPVTWAICAGPMGVKRLFLSPGEDE